MTDYKCISSDDKERLLIAIDKELAFLNRARNNVDKIVSFRQIIGNDVIELQEDLHSQITGYINMKEKINKAEMCQLIEHHSISASV